MNSYVVYSQLAPQQQGSSSGSIVRMTRYFILSVKNFVSACMTPEGKKTLKERVKAETCRKYVEACARMLAKSLPQV